MFQKLRLKLTLINVSIILVLFLLLVVFAYLFSEMKIKKHNETLAQNIVSEIQAGIITDLPHRPPAPHAGLPGRPEGAPPGPPPRKPPDKPPGPNFFFVKTSPTGDITFQSSGQTLDPERLKSLTEAALRAALPQDTIIFEQISYSYLKAPLTDQLGSVILFQDLTQETNMLRTVLTALLAVGTGCSVLSFGASFYMASRAMIPIKKAWQQQNDFLSDASHELRTPLSVIQTNLDIIRTSPDETVASQNKWLDNIQEEAIAMTNLVNSLLFLARADSAQQPLHKHSFDLTLALLQAASPFEAVAIQKQIFFDVSISAPVEFYGDEARLKQVIAILLDNALRHTPAGGKVLACLSLSAEKIFITITDSGEGIAAEHLDKVFNRFYQVDKSRNKGGSGLGLAIAKWIVDSHNGTITVTSKPGTGTTFTIQLPIKPNI